MYEAGTIVAGKYRIERVLGSGGMGIVVAATHLQLGTPVALKFLHEQITQNMSVVERFMREAQSSARLRGENVCRVSDVGNEHGQPYIVMELLTGQDLGTVLRTSGQLPVSMAAEVVMQACIALGEAHALGFVHRDIKPGNLFWTQRPDGSALIKVLDFGVAKAPDEINFSLTQTANVIGSPGYMSPEQLKSSKTVDARSDIWSLGIVLYELVTGRKPFHGESITELALKVAMDPTPPMSGGIPSSFESVILRCLEKEPARRYHDVAELAAALAPFVGPVRGAELAYAVGRTLKGAHTPLPSAATPPHGTQNTPTTLRGANGVVAASRITSRRNWRLPVVMGGGALVGVVLALVLVAGKKKDTSAAKAGDTTEPAKVESMKVEPARQMPATQTAAPSTATAPAPTPAAAAAPAATAATKAETKPAAKTETKPVAKAEAKTETKPVAKAEAKTETKPVAKTEAKAESKPIAKTETKPVAKAETKATTKPKSSATKATKTTKTTKPKEDVGDSRL